MPTATKPKPKRRIGTVEGLNCPPAGHKKPKAEQSVTSIPTPAWATINLTLLHQREGNWSVGYKIGCGELLRADSHVAGSYPSRENAIVGGCGLVLTTLHRQLDLLGDPKDKTSIRQLANAVRKFRARNEKRGKGKPPPIPAETAKLIHDHFCPRGSAEHLATVKPTTALVTFDPKAMDKLKRTAQPAAAIAEAVAIEPMTAAEQKALRRCEADMAKSGRLAFEALLMRSRALNEICERRLYRATHGTLEAYAEEVWNLSKSSAKQLRDVAKVYDPIESIAKRLKIEFTAESQFRPLAKLDPTSVPGVIERTARKVPIGAKGTRQPTAEILAEAAEEELTPPDELNRKRKAEAARLRAAHQRQGITVDPPEPAELPGQQHLFQEPTAEVPSGTATADMPMAASESQEPPAAGPGVNLGVMGRWHLSFSAESPRDGSDADYWNGTPNPNARKLRGFANCLREALRFDALLACDRNDLAGILHAIAAEISGESTLLHGLTHSTPAARKGRRAK
jgi:hypothetical protein